MKLSSMFLVSSLLLSSFSFAQNSTSTQLDPSSEFGENISAVRKPVKHKQFKESFSLAQKHWKQFRPAKYHFQLQLICFCRDNEPKIIFVESRRVVKVMDATTGAVLDRSQYTRYTIDGIFNQIQGFLNRNPYRVSGAFDAVNGLPIQFWVDPEKLTIDEEMGFAVSNLEID